jgi:hypothetical protein
MRKIETIPLSSTNREPATLKWCGNKVAPTGTGYISSPEVDVRRNLAAEIIRVSKDNKLDANLLTPIMERHQNVIEKEDERGVLGILWQLQQQGAAYLLPSMVELLGLRLELSTTSLPIKEVKTPPVDRRVSRVLLRKPSMQTFDEKDEGKSF